MRQGEIGVSMADVAEDQLDELADYGEGSVPTLQQQPAPESASAEQRVSPITKILTSILGGKKKPAAGAAPSAAKSVGGAPASAVAQKEAVPAVARPAAQMPGGALVTIVTRNEFYRDGFRRLLMLAIAQAIVIACVLVSLIAFITTGKSQDRYFATTADGRIMQLAPLDQPGNMTTAALMSWVALATSEIMSFGYNDYQRRLQASSRHFTHHGWETYTGALQASHIIDGMLANKEVLTASPRAAPILKQEGVINGKYRWIVQLQLQVDYDSNGGTSRKSNLNVTLVIERVPSLENPAGVGIEQWISTQG
jgi:intracellular multiplication protein IcmL